MRLRVEFYGIPRARAGVAACDCEFPAEAATLGDVLTELTRRFPALAVDCFAGNRLRSLAVANVGGERFVTLPETPLSAGQTLLILSADAGG